MIVIVVLLSGAIYWTVKPGMERRACRDQLRQISRALKTYHSKFDSFPPAYVLGPTGERMHSWRVLILPFLGHDDLYREYRLDEPWDSPHNQKLISRMPDVFGCPAVRRQGVTNYLAVVGPTTFWPEQYVARLRYVRDGISNTIQLVESADSDIAWTEPRDLSVRQALRRSPSQKRPTVLSPHRGDEGELVSQAAMGDGAIRLIHARTLSRLPGLLSINAGHKLAGVEWPADPVEEQDELPPPRAATEFKQTDVVPYPQGAIVRGRNQVYCSTIQLAWGEQRKALGGEAVRLEGDPPLARELNLAPFRREDLSEADYVARGGAVDDGIIEQIRVEISRKFPSVQPRLLDEARGHAALMYAYLFKSLPFDVEFDELTEPLQFQQQASQVPVASFGIKFFRNYGDRDEKLQAQVTILDYVNADDFVLRLETRSTRDELVLAKVAPGKTLRATIEAVRQRIRQPAAKPQYPHLERGESLAVPNLTVNLECEFTELKGLAFLNESWRAGGMYLSNAKQIVRFRLDKAGARLESEGVLVSDNGDSDPEPGRNFVFDKPFLIYLREQGAEQPYFALWVENAELMQAFSR